MVDEEGNKTNIASLYSATFANRPSAILPLELSSSTNKI
jgi:hypothetical protein